MVIFPYATECPRMNAIIPLGRPRERYLPEDKLVFSCREGAGKPTGVFLILEPDNEAINTVK